MESASRPGASPQYRKDRVEFQEKLITQLRMIKEVEEMGDIERINEARKEWEKVSLEQEIMLFEVPLKDTNLPAQQREEYEEYIKELRKKLTKLKG